MKLEIHNAPHIRTRESNRTVMADAITAILPLYAMAFYFYGGRSAALGAISVLTCFIAEWVCVIIAKKVPNIRDWSPVVTGLIIPLLMPASIDYYIVVITGLFAMFIIKHPFAGTGRNLFNPAVGAVAFAMINWPKRMFLYPVPFDILPIQATITPKLVNSPAYALMLNGVPTQDKLDILLGNTPGPMGATNILVLITCCMFLVVRNVVPLKMVLSYFVGAATVAFLFPRAGLSGFESILYELMTGYIVITGILLLTDPVTSPKGATSKVIYGALGGMLAIGFRHLGRYEDSVLFALIVMNSSVSLLDYMGECSAHKRRRKQYE